MPLIQNPSTMRVFGFRHLHKIVYFIHMYFCPFGPNRYEQRGDCPTMNDQMTRECERCNGKGKIGWTFGFRSVCTTCEGKGYILLPKPKTAAPTRVYSIDRRTEDDGYYTALIEDAMLSRPCSDDTSHSHSHHDCSSSSDSDSSTSSDSDSSSSSSSDSGSSDSGSSDSGGSWD